MAVTNLTKYLTIGSAEAYDQRIAPLKRFCDVYVVNEPLNSVYRFPFVETGSSAQTYAYSTGHNSPEGSVVGISATLNTYLYKQYNMTDQDLANATPESVQALGRRMTNALLSTMAVNVLNTATASFANFAQASGSSWNNSSTALALRESASNYGWQFDPDSPNNPNTLLTTPSLHTKILNNTNMTAYAYGSSGAIQNGTIRKYHGFNLFEVDSVPSTVKGVALNQNAIGLVMSAPTPNALSRQFADKIESYTVVQSPDGNNLPFAIVQYYLPSTKTLVTAIELIHGQTVLNPRGGFNLTVTNMNV